MPIRSNPFPLVDHTQFKHQGVYIIIGGLDNIGFKLGQYLAEAAEAQLIVLGQSELNMECKEILSQIESKGGNVLFLQDDLTDYDSLKTSIEKAKSHFDEINGIIIPVNFLGKNNLGNMDEKTFRVALETNGKACMLINKVIQDESFDIMITLPDIPLEK